LGSGMGVPAIDGQATARASMVSSSAPPSALRFESGAIGPVASCSERQADAAVSYLVQRARQHWLPSPLHHPNLHQVSRVAAATTIPVTNAAKQENSRRSFRILVMVASPVRPTTSLMVVYATHP
jgi:hypothetical protein